MYCHSWLVDSKTLQSPIIVSYHKGRLFIVVVLLNQSSSFISKSRVGFFFFLRTTYYQHPFFSVFQLLCLRQQIFYKDNSKVKCYFCDCIKICLFLIISFCLSYYIKIELTRNPVPGFVVDLQDDNIFEWYSVNKTSLSLYRLNSMA